ncbi:MAG: multicomponent Na+:H+ antiporter subunit B [Cellvibrionaceae bacterium]|jgi:multicomponent Na+:H+ antiporter subunit B
MEQLIVIFLLSILVLLTLGIIYLNDLLVAIILSSLYSLVTAAVFVVMDAVDVAFTEAAVGAGISTILLLGALGLTDSRQKPHRGNSIPAIIVVVLTGAVLIYGTLDLPRYGDPDSPANKNPLLAQHFIQRSEQEIDIPNVVTSVLASYRGYDTLGETVVVFTAGIAVLSLLGLRRRKFGKGEADPSKVPKDNESGR